MTQLETACETEDGKAREVIEAAAAAITKALCNITHAHRADHICLGGGVIEALPALMTRTFDRFQQRKDAATDGREITIVKASLGDRAGVIGAALLVSARSTTTAC